MHCALSAFCCCGAKHHEKNSFGTLKQLLPFFAQCLHNTLGLVSRGMSFFFNKKQCKCLLQCFVYGPL